MKKLFKPTLLASSALLLAISGTAFGDAEMSFSTDMKKAPANVNANVKFTINVPKILILRVGKWGDTVSNPIWNYAFGGHSLKDGKASEDDWNQLTATEPKSEEATTDGTLAVNVFSNTGGAQLSVSEAVDFKNTLGDTGFQKPSLSEISAKDGGTISHANFNNKFKEGDALKLTDAAGIVKLTDKWTYTYTPEKTPAAGIYEANVVYTLASI